MGKIQNLKLHKFGIRLGNYLKDGDDGVIIFVGVGQGF